MADKMRYRYGDTNPVMCEVDSAQVIEIGDMVWLNTDDARPASASSFVGGLATAQETFVDKFIGIAMQNSPSGKSDPIRIATTGVFEMDCASVATWLIGDMAGPDDNAGATALENQKVIEVTDAARAIGVVVKSEASAVTSILVDIKSTIFSGGLQKGMASA
jgi:hypothetical protein